MSRISFPRSSGLYNGSGTMRKGFGMTVTLASAAQLLKRHGLLREIIRADRWTLDAHDIEGADTAFSAITYDTRDVREGTLLCCKGRFKAEYLHDIDERGLAAYVADTDFSAETGAPGLIVNDARKAMSLLSAEFYGRPQDELTVVGITGTKGKTTTAYFTQAVLNAHSHGKAALFSSVDNCLDGHTYVESDLTTPESMDAFRMMREAADNGMKYLVMEVSSQAYKVERVYGLTFDVATFLNISPDHISPIEHPTFEDYLYCKRQIGQSPAGSDAADVTASPANAEHSAYRIAADGADLGEFRLALDGDFNYANAAAALAIAHAAGIDLTADAAATHAMEPVRIAGRMEQFHDPQSNTLAIVDYAHNYAGSAGNKAYDRRKEIVEAAQHRIDSFIFTAEDTDTEPFIDICMEMQRYITVPGIASTVISDRPSAVTNAIYDARAHADRFNIILIIGKGDERWIKDHNKHVPFEGDDRIVERMFA